MAYVAVISLKQTINGLLNSSRISLVSSSREVLEFTYNQTTSLQQVVERFNDRSSKRLDDLDGQIRDCAHGLEDVLEFYESKNYEDDPISPDFEEVRQEINSFAERVNMMEVECIQELSKPAPDENYEASVSPNNDLDVEMVGRSNEFDQTREYLLRRTRPDDLSVFALVGDAGTGRSMAAKTIFEDLCTGKQPSFDCGARVTLGTEYRFKEVLVCIVAQVDTSSDYRSSLDSRGEEEISDYMYKILENKRYMIVLDDICDVQALDCLRKSLPDESNGSIVIVTTSIKEVAQSVSLKLFETPARFFEEISWFILGDAMFGGVVGSIPREVEEAGMKIAENCRGRTISLAKTLLFLSKHEKTPEQWSKIAADKENPIFMIGDEIAEVHLLTSELSHKHS